jgi:hypothetical protein
MGKAKARVDASRDTLYRAAEASFFASSGTTFSIAAKIRFSWPRLLLPERAPRLCAWSATRSALPRSGWAICSTWIGLTPKDYSTVGKVRLGVSHEPATKDCAA